MTINTRLKVRKHNALSGNTASGRTGPAYDGGSERARGRKGERERGREREREREREGVRDRHSECTKSESARA